MQRILLACFLTVFSFSLLAADGSSGCGPGWYVFKKNSILSSALRVTTNGILFPTVTIGMTFGTSNCSKHSLVKTERESLKFATENYFEILTEAAKGEGEFLHSYAATLGCQKDGVKTFQKEMKKNYSKLLLKDSVNPQELLKNTYIIILENKELTHSCSLS